MALAAPMAMLWSSRLCVHKCAWKHFGCSLLIRLNQVGKEGGQHHSFSTPVTSVSNCVSSTFPSTEIRIPGLQINQTADHAVKILALLLGQHQISPSLLGQPVSMKAVLLPDPGLDRSQHHLWWLYSNPKPDCSCSNATVMWSHDQPKTRSYTHVWC